MRIEDLEIINQELPYNVVDDMAIFMRNDPMFYRKNFFPAVMRMKDCHDNGKTYNADKELRPIIEKAMGLYCSKFKLPKRPEEIMDDQDKKNLIQKLYSEEMTQIRKGAY